MKLTPTAIFVILIILYVFFMLFYVFVVGAQAQCVAGFNESAGMCQEDVSFSMAIAGILSAFLLWYAINQGMG